MTDIQQARSRPGSAPAPKRRAGPRYWTISRASLAGSDGNEVKVY